MIEHLRRLADEASASPARGGPVREYLQARILEALQAAGVFVHWAFCGGTALRFLYDLPRFSEDLDFSLIEPGTDAGLRGAAAEVRRVFALEGYAVDATVKEDRTVAAATIRFPGLPHLLGLSPHASHVLSIKLEVDTNPPPGAVVTTSIVRRHVTLNLCHHDRASLLAGKLHAILSRPWSNTKS